MCPSVDAISAIAYRELPPLIPFPPSRSRMDHGQPAVSAPTDAAPPTPAVATSREVMPGDRERPAADGKPQGGSSGQDRGAGLGQQPTQDSATRAEVEELSVTDRRVRAHEQAHMAAGGSLVRGGPVFEYRTGPDGQRYAVGGEVSLDVRPVSGDPSATIRKAERVKRAALAPADPSPRDRQVAAQAEAMANRAHQELTQAKLRSGQAPTAEAAQPSPDARQQDKPAVKPEGDKAESTEHRPDGNGQQGSPPTEAEPAWVLQRAVIKEAPERKDERAGRPPAALPGRSLPSAYSSAGSDRVAGFSAVA